MPLQSNPRNRLTESFISVGAVLFCMVLYKEVANELPSVYWEHGYDELSERFDCSKSTLVRARKHAGLPKKTDYNKVESTHGVSLERVLYHLHHDAEMSTPEMADALDISRGTLAEWFQREGVPKRSRSEAEKLKWDNMDEEQREKQVEAAHKATRKIPRFRTTLKGYEAIRHRRQEFKLHRLAAVAWYGIDAVKGKHVHHKNKIPWDNRKDNLELLEPAEHYRHHANERRDPETGRLV